MCLTFAEIGRLTDRQIYDVLLYPRDEKGHLQPKHVQPLFEDLPPTRENQRLVLFTEGAALGIPREELERVWREKWGDDDGTGETDRHA